ncbi:MAG: FeoB-associated Cys-rich membrane protein [Clostridia bacterium]|nr:FeoB-associated Cys-rich membrane protein [Clostridia bacterium]MBQ6059761.1 FeoB-associated Cys-rich membrane protein [Clostridia bacterium]
MLAWLSNNLGTIAAALVVLLLSGAAAATLIRDKKKGKSSCGCNCAHCAMAGSCHKEKQPPPPKGFVQTVPAKGDSRGK